MEFQTAAAAFYIERAFEKMVTSARRLEGRVSERPPVAGGNSVYAIVTHCIGMADFWLGHVICGEPSRRDRKAEFEAVGSLDELEGSVAEFVRGLPALLDRAVASDFPANDLSESVPWPWGVDSVVVHVIEEVYQHLGHIDITMDLLLADSV